jgi:hypothetical protein
MQAFCGCDIETHDEPVLMRAAKAKPRTFKYQLVYGNYPAYAFRGFTNAQTVAMIRKAMADLSRQSGAKFVEVTKNPNLRFYFNTKVPYGAIAAYMGDGKVYISQTRAVTAQVAGIVIQHETGHFLGVKASPASDKWGHCPVASCIMNVNGTGPTWCAKCRGQLVRKYGA